MKIDILKFTWLVILTTIGLPVLSYAQTGERMYIYASDGSEQSFALGDLNKITFSEQGINIFSTTNDISIVQYNSVIVFNPKSTAITKVKQSDIKLYWEANDLMIESDTEISIVKVYNLQGVLLVQKGVKSLSVTIPLPFCPTDGIYIVQVSTLQDVRIYKTIKN